MSGFAASEAQRQKVRYSYCAFCGRGPGCDPMHIIPRSLGGCDHQDCVAPACRDCHRDYDTGRLNALPALQALFQRELDHALNHTSPEGLRRRVTNQREAA